MGQEGSLSPGVTQQRPRPFKGAANPVPFPHRFLSLRPSSWSPSTDSQIHHRTPHILPDFTIPLTTQLLEVPRSHLILPSLSTWLADQITSPLLSESIQASSGVLAWLPGQNRREANWEVSLGIALPTLINCRLTSSPKPGSGAVREARAPATTTTSSSEPRCRRLPRASKVTGGVRVERARDGAARPPR